MTILFIKTADGGLTQSTYEWYEEWEEAKLIRLSRPADAGKLRKALRSIRDREARLAAAATQDQHMIGWGDHWVMFWDGLDADGITSITPATAIYGHVLTLGEFYEREHRGCTRLGYPPGQADDEIGDRITRLRRGHARGWRYSLAFSHGYPNGELDDQHIGLMRPLSRAEFAAAGALGWPKIPAAAYDQCRDAGRPLFRVLGATADPAAMVLAAPMPTAQALVSGAATAAAIEVRIGPL